MPERSTSTHAAAADRAYLTDTVVIERARASPVVGGSGEVPLDRGHQAESMRSSTAHSVGDGFRRSAWAAAVTCAGVTPWWPTYAPV